ncbi:MAG: zinc-dependent alcohol dehydrogenase family protein, partial [Nitrospirales bacterium]|nr:zinc-dependent alcohol dehydrogenase family protein [Nitrospirales bacterium]
LRTPGKGEVRLQVEAIGLNRAEILFRQGRYLEEPQLPSRLGYEAAGVVEAVGEGVTEHNVGNLVSTIPAFSMRQYGVYGDSAIVPASAVSSYPPSLSPIEAAAIWMQYLTGYFALFELGHLQSGQFVLITAATSSTGLAAIQMANSVGAISIATTRKNEKRQILLNAGAHHVIVTREENLLDRVLEITGGKGAEVIYDPIAGPGLMSLGEAVAIRGTIIVYGALMPEPTHFPVYSAFIRSFGFHVCKIFDFAGNPAMQLPRNEEAFSRGKRFVYDALASGKFKPIMDRTFSLENIVEAHRYMESNQQCGKIVVTV